MAAEQDEAAELDEALWDALRSLNPDAVRRALESGADPDGRHYNELPLTFVCRQACRLVENMLTEVTNPDPVACLAVLLEYVSSPNVVPVTVPSSRSGHTRGTTNFL